MEEICRLCCSTKFVNNYIFDEENALYLKMSLYLPIKVFKNDRLPQKVCDRCSCKVNDFYQFCNETIEVQNRLRAVLISTSVEASVDLTLIKQNEHSPPVMSDFKQKVEPGTEQHSQVEHSSNSRIVTNNVVAEKRFCDQTTQTDVEEPKGCAPLDVSELFGNVRVKEEPKPVEVKTEDDGTSDMCYPNLPSDNSDDDLALIEFQKKKQAKGSKVTNGTMSKRKRKKATIQNWDELMKVLPDATAVTMVENPQDLKMDFKQELDLQLMGKNIKGFPYVAEVKPEPTEYHCCVCLVQCYSRSEMLDHYKEHLARVEQTCAPPAPPPPSADPAKCVRCQKMVCGSEWGAHWTRHWERDRRQLRCALCEKTFRDHHHLLKHGLTHKLGEDSVDQQSEEKRFVCDVCPESFVYMRHLLAHRLREHPEAATRPLTLRCAICTREFAHLNSLRRHISAHKGERNFLCSICGKALSSREHLKFHVRIHTGYKPNVCKTCGKGFVKKCNLTLHERVHSGERPHVCAHCGKAFSQRSTLVIHERYHSGARPYVCALCKRGFVAKGLLSMHLKTTCI